ncbi:MAG: MFS transporter [Vampirovibrionales bacterium]
MPSLSTAPVTSEAPPKLQTLERESSEPLETPHRQWLNHQNTLYHSATWLVVGVCISHFMIDHYSSMITPLLPQLAHKLSFSKEAAGGLIALSSIGSSMLQPAWGWGSEQLGKVRPNWIPFLIPLAILMTGALLPWVVNMPSYASLAVLITFAYLGIGLFHPVGTALVHKLSPPEKKNWYMSLFMSSGVMGFSTGPKVVATIMQGGNLSHVAWLSVSCFLMLPLLLWHSWKTQQHLTQRMAHASQASVSAPQNPIPSTPEVVPNSRLKPAWQALRFKLNTSSGRWLLACLCFNNVCRTMLLVGFATFLPFLWTEQHLNAMQIADILFYATLIGGPLGILGGKLADKWLGEQWLLRLSFAPCLLLIPVLLTQQGMTHQVAYWMMAGCLSASMGANMVMALRHIEGAPNIISGMVAGWAFGIAGLCMKPVGAWIDLYGHTILFPFYLSMAVLGLLSVDVFPRLLQWCAKRFPEHQSTPVS